MYYWGLLLRLFYKYRNGVGKPLLCAKQKSDLPESLDSKDCCYSVMKYDDDFAHLVVVLLLVTDSGVL